MTRDPKVPNAKILKRVQSRASGFRSHSAVFTANVGGGSYTITAEKIIFRVTLLSDAMTRRGEAITRSVCIDKRLR